jgi:hypothetical protein
MLGGVTSAVVYVFRAAFSDLHGMERQAKGLSRVMVWLGSMPSLIASGRDFTLHNLLPSHYYDLFCVGWRNDGESTGVFAGAARFANAGSDLDIAEALMLHEAQFLAAAALGFSPDAASGIPVWVDPMTEPGQGATGAPQVGFRFGPPGTGKWRHGIVVQNSLRPVAFLNDKDAPFIREHVLQTQPARR